MSQFQELLANVRSALDKPQPGADAPPQSPRTVPVAPAARRAELCSRFVRELEAVGGRALQVASAAEAAAEIARLAVEAGAQRAALGQGVTIDFAPAAEALTRRGIAMVPAGPVTAADRREVREQMSQCEIAVAEADYAIAASGTLLLVADESSPRSLTLLPPLSAVVVHVDRILPDLASALRALGPAALAEHQVSLITGPSRTADIEKIIVLGVHGPKQLYAIVIWPREG